MSITLNGFPTTTGATTVRALLGEVPDGHAVAVNGTVVPRGALATHPVEDGDVVEVVTAVAGG